MNWLAGPIGMNWDSWTQMGLIWLAGPNWDKLDWLDPIGMNLNELGWLDPIGMNWVNNMLILSGSMRKLINNW